ncbi:hypothetical protein E1265_20630 [Streptomyces sp. 8K308]|nr:hypothetical protein E1265_20630 [Streptomyces sp. 8K308]
MAGAPALGHGGAESQTAPSFVGDILTGWPEGMRLIVRRERPRPGAQLRFTDSDASCISPGTGLDGCDHQRPDTARPEPPLTSTSASPRAPTPTDAAAGPHICP